MTVDESNVSASVLYSTSSWHFSRPLLLWQDTFLSLGLPETRHSTRGKVDSMPLEAESEQMLSQPLPVLRRH